MVKGCKELLRIVEEHLSVAAQLILQVDIECVTRTIAGDLRGCHSEHLGIFDIRCAGIHLPYHRPHGMCLSRAVAPRF